MLLHIPTTGCSQEWSLTLVQLAQWLHKNSPDYKTVSSSFRDIYWEHLLPWDSLRPARSRGQELPYSPKVG